MTNEERIVALLERQEKQLEKQGAAIERLEQGQQELRADVKGLQADVHNVKHGQQEQSEAIARLEQGQARNTTAFEALEAGLNHLLEQSATKHDIYQLKQGQTEIKRSIHDLDVKAITTLKRHQRRMDNAGLPDPDKH